MSADDDLDFVRVLLMAMSSEDRDNLVAASLRLADDLQAAIQAELDK